MANELIPSGERPAMFIQWGLVDPDMDMGIGVDIIDNAHRIRIVYPNGKIEWMSMATTTKIPDDFVAMIDHMYKTNERPDTNFFMWDKAPCYWVKSILDGMSPRNFEEAMCLIASYDADVGYEEMEFICEL